LNEADVPLALSVCELGKQLLGMLWSAVTDLIDPPIVSHVTISHQVFHFLKNSQVRTRSQTQISGRTHREIYGRISISSFGRKSMPCDPGYWGRAEVTASSPSCHLRLFRSPNFRGPTQELVADLDIHGPQYEKDA
jgi:hypothetical protein